MAGVVILESTEGIVKTRKSHLSSSQISLVVVSQLTSRYSDLFIVVSKSKIRNPKLLKYEHREKDRQTNVGPWMHADMVGINMRYV